MRWREKFTRQENVIESLENYINENKKGYDFRETVYHAVLSKETVHQVINKSIFQYSLHYVSKQLHE